MENRAETYKRLGEEYDASRETRTPGQVDEGEEGDLDMDFVNYDQPI